MSDICPDSISLDSLKEYMVQSHQYGDKLVCSEFTELLCFLEQAPRDAMYQVQELLHSGKTITHKHRCDYSEMAWYTKAIFITSVPPMFLIWELTDE